MEIKRKTPTQLEALDSFYLENNHPSQMEMENYAKTLGLSYKQIRSWFVEKRRKDKRDNTTTVPLRSATESHSKFGIAAKKAVRQSSNSKHNKGPVPKMNPVAKRKKKQNFFQDIFSADYILAKVFRKDGPPLGIEFDSLPSRALFQCKDTDDTYPSSKENQIAMKRRKVSACNDNDAPIKKHGMGKGLMTVWRATNPHAGICPIVADSRSEGTKSGSRNSRPKVRRPHKQNISAGRLRNKLQEKKKQPIRSREMEFLKDVHQQLPYKEKCELALEERDSQENIHQISMLMDDEELEARELRSVPNPPGCSGHFTSTARQGCSLCKDRLAKFPPQSVKMKQPFGMQPWESSTDSVKKLFKVFHFLYTYSLEIDVCPFTLDEFAQAFHNKDSLLLGKINLAFLKLLLSDIEVELNDESSHLLGRSCNYLALLHLVKSEELTLEFWRRSLNPLTWTEILRQVLVAAGFGSKQSTIRRESIDKDLHLMLKYGLHPGTLKGELFKILLEQGNNGLKVSDLSKSLPIVDLKLASTTEEVECLVGSVLSSDITLFEKISSATYRLRINTIVKKVEELQSDSEDCGAVDDDLNESGTYSSDEDSGCDVRDFGTGIVRNLNPQKSKNSSNSVSTEIDESHPGEAWLLGLTEGEYSDLSIEEKLDAFTALMDLLREGRTIRMEDPSTAIVECTSNIYRPASGGKTKRSTAKHQSLSAPSLVRFGQIQGVKEAFTHWKCHAIDSSVSFSKSCERSSDKGKDGKGTKRFLGVHPMQSIFLGSDRTYNRYWLFLGPCNGNDPGHRRIYFESSEDGHWEVIDTEEGLNALLSVLDDRGKREALLIESLEKRQASLCETMSSRMTNSNGLRPLTQSDQPYPNVVIREDSFSPVSDVENSLARSDVTGDTSPPSGTIVLDGGNKGEEKKLKWFRLQEFDKWIWNFFYSDLNSVKKVKRSYFDSLTRCDCCHDLYWRDEKHCRVCHTTFEIDFDQEERYAVHAATCRDNEGTGMYRKVLCSQIQALKAATYAIESAMPKDSLIGAWTKSAHKLWVKRLRRTSSLQELFQVLADFIGAINQDWLCRCETLQGYDNGEEVVASFACLPRTTSALALWLVKLDALISPFLATAAQGNISRG